MWHQGSPRGSSFAGRPRATPVNTRSSWWRKLARRQGGLSVPSRLSLRTRVRPGAWAARGWTFITMTRTEGKPFNDELGKMTDAQWRELVRAMHEVDQNILVITMMFQNFTHRGRHKIETEGYHGKAYYPSKLFPGRMPIASPDPLEAILSEADRLGMQVMPGVGCYAFFDYTPGSLRWCKQVADELWERYGHHPSFYGWYVSEEKDGGLGECRGAAGDRRILPRVHALRAPIGSGQAGDAGAELLSPARGGRRRTASCCRTWTSSARSASTACPAAT